MAKRTLRDFSTAGDSFAVVDSWAKESGYHLSKSSESEAVRLYQKGNQWVLAPMMVEMTRKGETFHLEAWVKGTLLNRILSLFMAPAEIGLESGGFRMVAPRSVARKDFNNLLKRLNQPLVK